MLIRRVVFGEPKPGEAQFAAVLQQRLGDSVSYCNRVGPLQHDRVTDVPFTVPALGLNFVHPTPMKFVSAAPPADDSWGVFRFHHAPLYYAGAQTAGIDPVHVEAARLCELIYGGGASTFGWDAFQETSGVVWAVKHEDQRSYVVFRGSDALLDWLRDVTGLDPKILLARLMSHDKFGVMWDGFVVGMPNAWQAIKPLIAQSTEVVFTGHSLGAARADVAAGYAALGV